MNSIAKAQHSSRSLTANDGDDSANELKVLNDGDGAKLLMELWSEYISEHSFIKFPAYMKEQDALLLKYRNGRTLTQEERDAKMADAPPKRSRKKKKKSVPTSDVSDAPEMTASDIPNSQIFAHYMSKGLRGEIA